MNCPKCGNPLRMSKKSPGYALCDTCRKKFRLPDSAPKQGKNEEEEEHYPKYANIPPKTCPGKTRTGNAPGVRRTPGNR